MNVISIPKNAETLMFTGLHTLAYIFGKKQKPQTLVFTGFGALHENAGGRTWKDTTLKKCRKDKALAAVFFSGQPIGQPNILDYLRVTPFPTNIKKDIGISDTLYHTWRQFYWH